MKDLTKYIDTLLEGVVDNYEVEFKDEVYNVTLIVDITNRGGHLKSIVPMLCLIGVNGIVGTLKRYLPDDLYTVTHKVIDQSCY
jgi:hypothetical protein